MAEKQKYPLDPVLLARARAMRSESAPAEQKLWALLRNRQLANLKFRRQTPLGTFIADFFCRELNLVVELDGDSHGDGRAERRDRTRSDILLRDGHHVIRFWNTDVYDHIDAVLEEIYSVCDRLRSGGPPHPSPLPEGEGERADPLSHWERDRVRGRSGPEASNFDKNVVSEPSAISSAVCVIHAGGLVAIPTETVYGLGADATNRDAVLKIFAAKGRPATNPLICHIANAEVARRYTTRWDDRAEQLAKAFWPGPLTLVLPKHPSIVDEATAGLTSVGLRVPNHPLTLQLLHELAGAVAAPSANRTNRISPTTAQHVREELGDSVDLILDGGPCTVGIESTVLDLAGVIPRILRPGGISREQIEAIIGPVEQSQHVVATDAAAMSPGQLPVHYAPSTPAFYFEPAQLPLIDPQYAAILPISLDPEAYARHFYARLRMLDGQQLRAIYIELPPDVPQWHAVRDRILRAAKSLSIDREK